MKENEMYTRIKFVLDNAKPTKLKDNSFLYKIGNEQVIIGISKDKSQYLKYEIKKPDFIEYLERLDDDIFVQACEYFKDLEGDSSLLEFDKLIKENKTEQLEILQNKFKKCVKDVVYKEIERLTSKYL